MAPSDEKPPPDREASEDHRLASDLLRLVEEYARDLQQAIQKLRKRLH